MLGGQIDTSLKIDNRHSVWLPESKTKIFKKLFDQIAEKVGGVKLASAYIGLSGSTQDTLYKKSITYETAQKILSAHKKLIKKNA